MFEQVSVTAILREIPPLRRTRGPLGQCTIVVSDTNGNAHEFLCDSFSNTYERLTLATHQSILSHAVAVPSPSAMVRSNRRPFDA